MSHFWKILFVSFLAPCTALGLQFWFDGDKLSLVATDEPLESILQQFARGGVVVKVDSNVLASVTGTLDNQDIESSLEALLKDYGYVLIWDVLRGPLGDMPRLAEIQVFKPGHEKDVRPLLVRNANFEVTRGADSMGPAYVQDEILIGFKSGTEVDEFRRLLYQVGGTVIGSISELGIYRVQFAKGANVEALLAQLSRHPAVAAVEPNYVYDAPQPISARPAAAGLSMELPKISVRGGVPPVAILDSGLSTLEGLSTAIVGSYDAVDPERDISDPVGHGTQMALIAAGVVRPAGAENGVDEGQGVLAVRSFDDNGRTSNFTLMRGLTYAHEMGARVVNMSWGSETRSEFMANAIGYAQQKGMVIVAASGNEPTGRQLYPAAFDGVMAVSATKADGSIWERSNYGDHVFLAAPGMAEFPVGHNGPPGAYAGTSIASAYVAGALARYFAAHPKASMQEAVSKLRSSLTDLGPDGRDPQYGYGLLDEAALSRFLD